MARTLGLFATCLLIFLLSLGANGERGRERVYYVGIIEDLWDYAPSGKNLLNGKAIEDDEHASIFLQRGPHRIGSIYKKAVFREYTDASYSRLSPRPDWLGFLGPILRAEVDETIVVHLKNFATRNYSMHPHGVFYEKDTEGALYPDGTSSNLKKDDCVPPGGSYTYRWEVKPEFGPTDDDANCLTWVYHSHIDAPRDISSGLIGALLTCKKAGMQVFYEVRSCNNEAGFMLTGGVVRNYYLAAEKVLWNYAPSGRDLINNVSLTEADSPSDIFFGRDEGRLGGQYIKVIYKEYTDDTFTTEKSADLGHLGILGPVLRAEEGDTLRVTFLNKGDRNYSIQPHGLHYDKHSQGSSYEDGVEKPGSHVGPGENFTYTWQVLEGPSSSDSSCIPYLYYSATDPAKDTNSGLVGPLLVCKRGALLDDGRQKDVDKEFFLLFSVMDENMSWYLDENIKKFGSNETDPEHEDFEESNMMHAVNGRMYGNLLGLEMCSGDKVRWYTFGLGTEVDIHGVYFEGNTFNKQSTTRDTLNIFPHTTVAVDMKPDTPGVYEVSCTVIDHYSGGMRQQYKVNQCPGKKVNHKYTKLNKTARYFISAEEIEWDYSPKRDWELEKHHSTPKDSPGNIFVGKGKNRIGSRYKKVVYREYTDDTFSVQKKRQPDQQHLEILGPIIKAEVGEQIVIIFKNNATRPYSITTHGVRASGGHIAVKPGHFIEVTWDVPQSSGPGVTDPNCISYIYYSTVDFVMDLYSGLLGPLVICRPGTLKRGEGPDRERSDVEREFALLFMVHDENKSWYLGDNIRTYLGLNPENFTPDEEFEESNKMHGINGKLYGNLHGLEMTQGQKVDWYLIGMGNEVDMHTVHFHAETFTYKTDLVHRADVFDLFPGTFQTVEMVAGNPGTWLLHCHVTDHIHAGMETTFTIKVPENSSHGTKSSIKMLLSLFVLLAIG
ncbi:unnamed protein product [Oreochromis niloticus]|nr:unnamed protein product [Mustela putorius furo]